MNKITEWVCWRQLTDMLRVPGPSNPTHVKTQDSGIDVLDVDWFSDFDMASKHLASAEKDWLLLNAAARAGSQQKYRSIYPGGSRLLLLFSHQGLMKRHLWTSITRPHHTSLFGA